MAKSTEGRFTAYLQVLSSTLAHLDRHLPAQWYLRGLILPGGRKSVEPMAARVQPDNVRSAHQSMHHFVADADWSDAGLLAAVSREVLPSVLKSKAPVHWIVDDTGFSKKGIHSVGVGRQYCGRMGKTDNCQIAVSLSIANETGSLPLDYQLYLPQEWAKNKTRRARAGVPRHLKFQTKTAIALQQIDAALSAQIPPGIVLADAAYGTETEWRDQLSARGLSYMVAVRDHTSVWWGPHQPAPARASTRRPRLRPIRDAEHAPISVKAVAHSLPGQKYRRISWREGTAAPLSSHFAALRVRAAPRNERHEEPWLLIEWPRGASAPRHYWFSTLPADTPLKTLVATAQGRWRIERDYQELKSELGLYHFEGRGWRGFHHHATLCIAAYGFLMRERLEHLKKNSPQLKDPTVPKAFRPRGARPDATPRSAVDPSHGISPRPRDRTTATALPVLRASTR